MPSAPAPAPELSLLRRRLTETSVHPLQRVSAADLSEEARAIAGALNERLDAVAAAEKEQQQFIADVSHELRTPLTVMRGSLEVALEEDRPAEEYREAIGNALLEVRHLTRLSQNLLFLARGQAGRITLSFANADLVKFIFKEDVVPGHVHKWMYILAPSISVPAVNPSSTMIGAF